MFNIIFKIERWKYNKEYGVYVSTQGRIRSKTKVEIKPNTTNTGYLRVNTNGGKVLVHRLVMYTWRPTDGMKKLTVDHLNHNKRDNSLNNLEWVTRKENQRRAKEDFDKSFINCPEVILEKPKVVKESTVTISAIENFEVVTFNSELQKSAIKTSDKRNKEMELNSYWDEPVYVNGILMTYRIMADFFWTFPTILGIFKRKCDFQNAIQGRYQLDRDKEYRLLSKKSKNFYNCATINPIGVKIND